MLLRLLRARQRIDFRGRVVMIVGGSRGLGLCLARQLAEEGAKLVLVARDEEKLSRAAREIEALGGEVLTVACDATDEDAPQQAIQATIKRFHVLDALINNAGIIQVGPIEHMGEKDFDDAINIHMYAPLRWMRSAAPYLKRSAHGRIVNIASIGGLISVPHMAPYTTSKFGLVGLSDALRHEFAKNGVAITTVCPGMMRTGSHVAARFKGRHALEYKMFKMAASLPGGSVNADKAAELIIDAMRHGDPQLVFPLPFAWASVLYRLFPNTAALVLGTISRILPGPTEDDEGDYLFSGKEIEEQIPSSPVTKVVDEAAVKNNEVPKSEQNGHAVVGSISKN